MRRLRVAWFSDLGTGSEAGVSAYCSRLLLPELSKYHEIELFGPSFGSREWGLPHHHYLNAYKRHREHPFDVFFYQVEDARSSRFVRSHLGLMPGVVWLHDLYFRDLGPEALHTSPWEFTIKQFVDPGSPFVDRSFDPHQLTPKAYRETSLAPVALFSSQWALNEFARTTSVRLESDPGAQVAQLLPVPIVPRSAREDAPVIGLRVACASVTGLEGRSHKFLPALARLGDEWSLTWMVPTGEENAARDVICEYGVEPRVSVIAGQSPEEWERIVSTSDVALHLHTSPFGHLGPCAQLSLAAGCVAVVSWAAGGEDFPEEAVFRVAPGLHEATQLTEIFQAVQANGSRALGQSGRLWIERSANVALVAKKLSEGLISWAPRVQIVMDRWQRLLKRGKQGLLEDVRAAIDGDAVGPVSPFDQIITKAASDLGWL